MPKTIMGDAYRAFQLSQTFGTVNETDKDRAKRELMEFMPPVKGDNEVIVIDPEAEFPINETSQNYINHNITSFSSR